MKKMIIKIGVGVFSVANIYILYNYIRDAFAYFNDRYHYDGMRYLMPFVISDIMFLFALIVLYFELGFSKYLIYFLVLVVLHNMVVGLGGAGVLFWGIIIVITSLIYSFFIIKKIN